jgi:3-(3-hydroxy-phenyl)propionate hydroxylase
VTTAITIVGAGPVGLTAALALGRSGHQVQVFDQAAAPSQQWRASTFHAPTLEMCAELGVAGAMLAQGLKAPVYQIRDRDHGIIAEFDMGVLATDTDYPFRLQLEQYKYVSILLAALTDLPGVTVEYGRQVTAIEVPAEGPVSFEVDGETRTTGLLIGADGASSTVRKAVGAEFEGQTYGHRYLLLSVDGPVEEVLEGIALVNYVADPDEHMMILRIPDLWRVMFEVPTDVSDELATSDDYVRRTLNRLHPGLAAMPVPSKQLYKVHQRVARTFRQGGAVIVGDAAHVNSPIGGMGLNSGIHDAVDLSRVVAEGGDLAEWARRRRRVALDEIQRITHENTQRLSEVRTAQADGDHELLAEIAADPVRSREFLLEASMIANARRHTLRP